METPGAGDMQHGAAQTPAREARGGGELLGGDVFGDVQDALVRPIVVVIEFLDVGHAHGLRPFDAPTRNETMVEQLLDAGRKPRRLRSANTIA